MMAVSFKFYRITFKKFRGKNMYLAGLILKISKNITYHIVIS